MPNDTQPQSASNQQAPIKSFCTETHFLWDSACHVLIPRLYSANCLQAGHIFCRVQGRGQGGRGTGVLQRGGLRTADSTGTMPGPRGHGLGTGPGGPQPSLPLWLCRYTASQPGISKARDMQVQGSQRWVCTTCRDTEGGQQASGVLRCGSRTGPPGRGVQGHLGKREGKSQLERHPPSKPTEPQSPF